MAAVLPDGIGIPASLVANVFRAAHHFCGNLLKQFQYFWEPTAPFELASGPVFDDHPAESAKHRVKCPVVEAVLRCLSDKDQLKLPMLARTHKSKTARASTFLVVVLRRLDLHEVVQLKDINQDSSKFLKRAYRVFAQIISQHSFFARVCLYRESVAFYGV